LAKRNIQSLRIECRIEQLAAGSPKLPRVEELFQRTTQFNTTGRKFSATELAALTANPDARLFAIEVSDRLGDHGLVGAAVIENFEITGLAISCRALGMGIEHTFLRHVFDETKAALRARVVPSSRNIPARNIFRDNGFVEVEGGVWQFGRLSAVG